MLDKMPIVSNQAFQLSKELIPTTNQMGYKAVVPSEGGLILFDGLPSESEAHGQVRDLYFIVPVFVGEDKLLNVNINFWEEPPYTSESSTSFWSVSLPGFVVQLVIPLSYLDLNRLKLPRTPGRLKCGVTPYRQPIHPERVTSFALEFPASAEGRTVWFGEPYLSAEEPEYVIPDQPIVDELGQWTRKDWHGKTKSVDELVANLQGWLQVAEEDRTEVMGHSIYGGWKELQFEASGFFRTEHDGKRWWLVDPEGYPFISTGLNCVRPHMDGPVSGVEPLLSWLPDKEGQFKDAWLDNPESEYSYTTTNLIRAFGESWKEKWEIITKYRMKKWGFNTVANWSLFDVGSRMKIPYVTSMEFPVTEKNIFRDFPDVFSPEYTESADVSARSLIRTADDPYLIGYFMRNEPAWAFGDYIIAEFLLTSSEELHSKRELIRFLEERYRHAIGGLNEAWKTSFSDFAELNIPMERMSQQSKQAERDLRDFTEVLISEYIRVPAEAARKFDPNHLNLGMRWAWVATDALYAGSEYVDVFSINGYQLRPDAEVVGKSAEKSGKPVIIGEFHAGALDAGLPSYGLLGVTSQEERGKFYSWYVEHGAALPDLVGFHYFTLNDQPVLGRFDGENYNIGFVDIALKPYEPMVEAAMVSNRRIYGIHAGRLEPTIDKPITVAK